MPYREYLEPSPLLHPFFDFTFNHRLLPDALKLEEEARKGFDPAQRRELFKELGKRFPGKESYTDPLYGFAFTRIVEFFPQASREGTIEDAVNNQVEAMEIYHQIFSDGYFGEITQLPQQLLWKIAAEIDYHAVVEYLGGPMQDADKPKLLIARDIAQLGWHGQRALSYLKESTHENGKAFLIGKATEVGGIILETTKSNRGKGYPFYQVAERGCWSLDYFISEEKDGYVQKNGFSPHQNVVMTFLEHNKKPFCRISSDQGHWLMKLDFAREGYNPGD